MAITAKQDVIAALANIVHQYDRTIDEYATALVMTSTYGQSPKVDAYTEHWDEVARLLDKVLQFAENLEETE
jgi:hypothetical protein